MQGAFENLTLIRKAGVKCPLLCKEFIVEPYQVGYGLSSPVLFLCRSRSRSLPPQSHLFHLGLNVRCRCRCSYCASDLAFLSV